MPSVKVNVSPYILEWVLKAALLEGIDDELITHLYKWKNNEKQPTFCQIEEFSKKTHIPLGYFFLQSPPREQLPLLNFRTIDSTIKANPSRDLIDTYYNMTAIQDWMRDYLLDAGSEKLSYVGICKNEKRIEKITEVIRDTINLDIDWYSKSKNLTTSFDFLRQCFESVGILVMKNGIVGQNTHRPLDIYEFRAFTLLDEYAPLIFINNKDSPAGQLFSLLHEAAHLWFGLYSFYNDSYGIHFNVSPLETICNAIAAELLVPKQFFIDMWDDKNLSIHENIENLVKYFKCGNAVIVRKALDNNFISNEQYQEIVSDIVAAFRSGKVKSTGGNYYDTIKSRYSSRFILALANSLQEGRTLFNEVHRLTGTRTETFNNFVKELQENKNAQ